MVNLARVYHCQARVWLDYNGEPGSECIIANRVWLDYNGEPGSECISQANRVWLDYNGVHWLECISANRVWLDYNGEPGSECIIANRVWLDYNGNLVQSVSVPTEYGLTITVNLARVYHCQQSMA